MISSTHITVGAAIGLSVGRAIPDPILSIPVALLTGLVSHHILDSIPHTDPGSFRELGDHRPASAQEILFALPDNLIATITILAFFYLKEPSFPMLIGAIGGNLPDVWHNVDLWSRLSRQQILPSYYRLHQKMHWTARGNLIPLGILTNLILIVSAIYYIAN